MRFLAPLCPLPVGASARLRILARDVSLTLHRQNETSILNILPARIIEVRESSDGQMLLRLMVGTSPLLARVSRKSFMTLGLAPGHEVFAQIKGVSMSTFPL
jgi:molybdate transport system ATP-binding protein